MPAIPRAIASPQRGESGIPRVESALYKGTLRHRRFKPVRHDFTHSLFMVFLEVDRIPELMDVSPCVGYNRWNWASFDERDHLGDPCRTLRERLADDAARHGLQLPDGPAFLLTHLRYLGYCFNPVSFFYCYDTKGSLELILAEVHNTFGESQNYWLSEPSTLSADNALRYRARKALHVSPFLKMDLDYNFVFKPPGEQLSVHMKTLGEEEIWTDATLSLTRRPWRAAELHRALLVHPWMTAKVMAAIHWQALRLFLKGAPFHPHPGSSDRVTKGDRS